MSSTSPIPAFVIIGIPIAMISPCLVGDEDNLEKHGLIKTIEKLLKDNKTGTSCRLACLVIILSEANPCRTAAAEISTCRCGEIKRNFAVGTLSESTLHKRIIS